MIIAIDESGTFRESAKGYSFFAGVHLRQLGGNLEAKKEQFTRWESSLPRSLKNHQGEIKSSHLSDLQLFQFVKDVLLQAPYVGITPIAFNPARNPATIVSKHKFVEQAQFNDGVLLFAMLGKPATSRFVKDLSNWFRKLKYDQFAKILTLGHCITHSLNNAVGHSISGDHTDELLHLQFKIDKIFVHGRDQNAFWHEILRNQLYNHSLRDPLPVLKDWVKTGHPFMDKYSKDGKLDLNELFWKHCSFDESHQCFEIRIAML
jgi:hypothetical protein